MVNITIDNHTIAVPSGTTIMEAAASIHIPIPKLCYLKDINEIALKDQLPFIITGDFNAYPDSEVIKKILKENIIAVIITVKAVHKKNCRPLHIIH